MWPEKHGKTYRIRDRRGDQIVTIESGYPNKTAAKNAIAHLRSDQLRGTDVVPRGGRTTLNEWIDVWEPAWESALKSTSAHSEKARIRNHIRPLLGTMRLDEVDHLAVQTWIGRLRRGAG